MSRALLALAVGCAAYPHSKPQAVGQQCTPACYQAFYKCFSFVADQGNGEDWQNEGSAYLTCRAEVDAGNPNGKLAKAGCVAGCADNPEMAELKGGEQKYMGGTDSPVKAMNPQDLNQPQQAAPPQGAQAPAQGAQAPAWSKPEADEVAPAMAWSKPQAGGQAPASKPLAAAGGAQCTPSCYTEFYKCFTYVVGQTEEEEEWIAKGSAYLTCRAEIDAGDPNSKLGMAGCVAGCQDSPEMAEIKGVEGKYLRPDVNALDPADLGSMKKPREPDSQSWAPEQMGEQPKQGQGGGWGGMPSLSTDAAPQQQQAKLGQGAKDGCMNWCTSMFDRIWGATGVTHEECQHEPGQTCICDDANCQQCSFCGGAAAAAAMPDDEGPAASWNAAPGASAPAAAAPAAAWDAAPADAAPAMTPGELEGLPPAQRVQKLKEMQKAAEEKAAAAAEVAAAAAAKEHATKAGAQSPAQPEAAKKDDVDDAIWAAAQEWAEQQADAPAATASDAAWAAAKEWAAQSDESTALYQKEGDYGWMLGANPDEDKLVPLPAQHQD